MYLMVRAASTCLTGIPVTRDELGHQQGEAVETAAREITVE